VLSSFDEVYDIPWPGLLRDFIAIAKFANFNFLAFSALSCAYPNADLYVTLHMLFVFPFALLLFMAIAWCVRGCCYLVKYATPY
jgi:hypothetical protein